MSSGYGDGSIKYYENHLSAVSSTNNVSCFCPQTDATPPTNIKEFRYANVAGVKTLRIRLMLT